MVEMTCLIAGIVAVFSTQTPATQIKVTASPTDIAVAVDGQPVVFTGTGPKRIGGRVLVPLRGVLEKIGATVTWNPDMKAIHAERGTSKIDLKIGERVATVDGRTVTLDAPAVILSGSTMVPLRFMGEALGAQVVYEEVGSSTTSGTGAMAGVWYLLDSEDKFVKTTKITFTKAGRFTFVGSAWKSEGTFTFADGTVYLVWVSVDGQAVKPGTMKKSLPVTDNATRMQLDRFRYGKS